MVLAWKAGVVKATEGSNPSLSAIFYLVDEKRRSAALSLLHVNGVSLRYALFRKAADALHLSIFDQP